MRRIYHPRISDSEGTLPVIHGGLGSRDIDKAAQNIGLVTYRLANKPFGIILYNAQKRINKDSLPPEISDPSVPSLYGNREVEVGQTLILKVTNYDSFTIYSVFATNGVAFQRGEEIHYTAGAVSGLGSITINGRTFSVTIKSPRPLTPSVVVPSEDSQLTNTTATFEATAFNITGNYDTHASTDWEVSTDPQFNTLIAAIYETPVHKFTWTVNNMQELKKHYVRVRYRGQQLGVSDWSPVREFTTGNDGLINTQTGIIFPADGKPNDGFGYSVSLNGDATQLVATAPFEDSHALNAGAIYYFTRSGSVWTQQQKILVPDSVENEIVGFQIALSLDGNHFLVGSRIKNTYGGAVYYFKKENGTWVFKQTITNTSGTLYQQFGHGVAISGDGSKAIIGAPADSPGDVDGIGSCYYYVRAGDVWSEVSKIPSPEPELRGYFGSSAGLNSNGDVFVVGAYNKNDAGIGSGAIYVFTRTNNTWSLEGKITPDGLSAYDRLGLYLSMNSVGDVVVARGRYFNPEGVRTYAYLILKKVNGVWTTVNTFGSDDARPSINTENTYLISGIPNATGNAPSSGVIAIYQ